MLEFDINRKIIIIIVSVGFREYWLNNILEKFIRYEK